MATAQSVLEHVNANLQHGRHLREFVDWVQQREQTSGVRARLLTLQELQEGQGEEVAERLGLVYVPAPENRRPGSRNALFYDAELFAPDPEWIPVPTMIRHRPATAKLYMRDSVTGDLSRRKLIVASVHAKYSDPNAREAQARELSELFKDLRVGFASGDWNDWSQGRAPLTLDNVADRAWAQNRSVLGQDGVWRPDDRCDRILRYGGMIDLGRYADSELGQRCAYLPTTQHGPNKDRQRVPKADCPPAGLSPIDRTYGTGECLSAFLGAETVDEPATRALSDHLVTTTSWNLDALREVLNREVNAVRH
ncbi:hypothetical protein [Streptomyces sp. TLI_171]|uniref:hypothetical protein n=1 Tax=Streptomyces sp. TLI_171 TaxID=1938859 RepID=UPI000C1797B7|nr:hypothetical protein [Streptomyces sp. TLI_171]RKE21938.1 hypothetical protein BX266_5346 [Streptomyces sp. TLI_171]